MDQQTYREWQPIIEERFAKESGDATSKVQQASNGTLNPDEARRLIFAHVPDGLWGARLLLRGNPDWYIQFAAKPKDKPELSEILRWQASEQLHSPGGDGSIPSDPLLNETLWSEALDKAVDAMNARIAMLASYADEAVRELRDKRAASRIWVENSRDVRRTNRGMFTPESQAPGPTSVVVETSPAAGPQKGVWTTSASFASYAKAAAYSYGYFQWFFLAGLFNVRIVENGTVLFQDGVFYF